MQNEIIELRNQVRTLKRIVYGFGCVLVAGIVVGATSLQTVPDVIQAKKFEVVNDEGKIAATLHCDTTGGGYFYLNNSNGNKVVVLADPLSEGGTVVLLNNDGKLLSLLGCNQKGGFLSISDKNGKNAANIEARHNGGRMQVLKTGGLGIEEKDPVIVGELFAAVYGGGFYMNNVSPFADEQPTFEFRNLLPGDGELVIRNKTGGGIFTMPPPPYKIQP
jgi:hypothetical protein